MDVEGVRGGDGDDHIAAPQLPPGIVLSPYATLAGGPGNDDLFGGNSDDLLVGEEGNDELHGGSGTDTFWGGEGADWCVGETRQNCEA
jgi:Ca2+-binding RTX toxin-like protein